jgi:hypothetical protein
MHALLSQHEPSDVGGKRRTGEQTSCVGGIEQASALCIHRLEHERCGRLIHSRRP